MTRPVCFERVIERVFSGLTFISLLIYLDDIIVFVKAFHVHLRNLEEVLKRLVGANLKLNPEKCKFFQSQVSFLGRFFGLWYSGRSRKKLKQYKTGRTKKCLRTKILRRAL